MTIAEVTIRKKVITLVLVFLALGGGILAYQSMSRLEDPEFTIKDALVITPYPGATAKEVEEEVTDIVEQAAQLLGQTKWVVSESHVGFSIVTVTVKDKYGKDAIPQVWDELRRKINDCQSKLPPGAGPSVVNDDYGDVYGVYIAFTGEGYSMAELKDYLKFLKRELLLVKDVKKVEIFGVLPEVVYVEMLREKMSQLGITQPQIYDALASKNLVADAGKVRAGTDYVPIQPSGEFTSVDQFGDLLISSDNSGRLIYLRDVAKITRDYKEPPDYIERYDGKTALALGISTVSGGNVVTMGEALKKRFDELKAQAPIGIETGIISIESQTVIESVSGFTVSLAQAVIIVIIVLLLFMGVRCGFIIGGVLLITIFATFILMKMNDIALQRISLGALVIALGMLVDNAIVVAEGMLVKIQAGEDKIKAANDIVKQTMFPLLGGTLVAIIAFGAIGLSQDSTGEYCRSLFQVLAISLSLSWLTAMTITPFFCAMFLKPKPEKDGVQKDAYSGVFFVVYRKFLSGCLRFRWPTCAIAVGLLVIALYSFGFVDKSFFPASTRPQFMINYWLPEGTYIRDTEKKAAEIEKYLLNLKHVTHVETTVGQGAARFILTFTPEKADSCYAFFLVSVDDSKALPGLFKEVQEHLDKTELDGKAVVQAFEMGPGGGAKIEARFSGPDGRVLRDLAEQSMKFMYDDGGARGIRTDWKEMIPVVRPLLSEAQARRAGIERPDVCKMMQMSFDGTGVGIYRERDELLNIMARAPEEERNDIADMNNIQIWSPAANKMIPLRQVVSGFETVFEDSIRFRRHRRLTITVQCDQRTGSASVLLERLMPKINAINLPPGYMLEWGGEYENSADAQAGIAASAPMFALIMVLIVIFLFNTLRHPLVIWLTVPFVMIGVTAGLLLARQPFGFMALLGMLSLVGMQIKNAIVLIDEMNTQMKEGKQPYQAILDASVSRVRPVSMAAATTVLGMTPLLADAFFVAMAVTIMFGLSFACILTMIVVPVFYAIIFRVKWEKGA